MLDRNARSAAWEQTLPAEVRKAVERVTGSIVRAESVARKRSLGTALVLKAERGRTFFLKAARKDSAEFARLNREFLVNACKPSTVPAPAFIKPIWEGKHAALLFEYVEGRNADLSFGHPDVSHVIDMSRRLSYIRAWDGLPSVMGEIPALMETVKVARSLSTQDQIVFATALDRFDPCTLAGDRVIHYDLHPANLRITRNGEIFAVDWETAYSGAPFIDAVMLMMILVVCGHPTDMAEKLVRSGGPEYANAPRDSVTGLLALLTLNCEHAARFGPEGTRQIRGQAAQAGRSLLNHLMDDETGGYEDRSDL